jgi:Protein of unknown function (DUF3431)
MSITIIISRYNETLDWTLIEPFNKYKYIVYNKGPNDNFEKQNVEKIINLPNIGREGHTYLYHISNNYDNLSDIIVFFPGSVELPNKFNKAKALLENIETHKAAIFLGEYTNNIYNIFKNFKLETWQSTSGDNKSINSETNLELSPHRPYGKWYKYLFGNTSANWFTYYGIFSISKHDILQHPKSRYEFLTEILSKSSNPEVGHYIERSWGAIFHPIRYTKCINY